MRERREVGVGCAGESGAHGCVATLPGGVAERLERQDQIVDPLLGKPRDLLVADQTRLMTGVAAPMSGDLGALLGQRLIDQLIAAFWR